VRGGVPKRDVSTLFLIKIIPVIALVAISLFLLSLFYQYENQEFADYSAELRKTYIEQQKHLIQDETAEVIQLIEYAQRMRTPESLSEEGLKESLLKEVEKIRFGTNGYFFIYDYQGINLMHPMKPHLVGNNLYNLQDPNGVYVIRGLIDSAKAGGRYVNYVWDKPDTQRPGQKIGYSMGVEGWQWMVGTGVYIDDIEAVVQDKERVLAETLHDSMLYVVGIVVVALLAISFILFMLINRVSRSMFAYQQQIEQHNELLEYEVDKKTHNLQKASRTKDEFLASMSHELRTPLTAIIGNSEFLAEQEHDTEKQALIRSIEIAGRSQLALVNDILDMSKIESGKFNIDKAPFDLTALLEDVRHIFASRTADAGLEFVVNQKNEERYQLVGDGQRIGQILINLISNAIKFTEAGHVTLTTWATDSHVTVHFPHHFSS
jgi:signal transduction histidine kinase